MKLVLLTGGPGSGKSTQGSALMAMNTKFKHLSLGEVVRVKLQDCDHPVTKQYKELINSGSLLPDEAILEILESELAQITDEESIVLLDGYPRTETQYEHFKQKWGMPAALIHLDVENDVLSQRIQSREVNRCDDNEKAVAKRIHFYQQTTQPLIEKIKTDLGKQAITLASQDSIQTTSLLLYAKLQRIPTIHESLKIENQPNHEKAYASPDLASVSSLGIVSQLWQTGADTYEMVKSIQQSYQTNNFSFSVLGNPVVYLETPSEVKAVLEAKSSLGQVYRQFSMAAGLKHDFVATDSLESNAYKLHDGQINRWKLIHTALLQSMKSDKKHIEQLIDKHFNQTFLAEKSFELDTTFDAFFTSFWTEYLLGNKISVESYQETRQALQAAMKQCFYSNQYKSLDPTGLSSWLYSYAVKDELAEAKYKINQMIAKATTGSMIKRFKSAIETINSQEQLGLEEETIAEIVSDNAFDLFFEPDFLESVLYEALVSAVKENVDFHEPKARQKVYEQGMQHGFLFPIRSRILQEPVALKDGSLLPSGSTVYLNLLEAGIYHSSGPRRCVGQGFTYFFKDHFFKNLEGIEFKVKAITTPLDRQVSDGSVPVSPERYLVSWKLKRDEAMRHLTHHQYKGNTFFDVLSLHKNPTLNTQMVKQLTLKIMRNLEKNALCLSDVVIVTPEVRGVPIASQVAANLQLPLYIIRKKGGYKMGENEVYSEAYDKGYGDPDVIELPIEQVKSLAGKKIIFLDDGLASGKSALACLKLVERSCDDNKEAAKVIMVMALLKHDYVTLEPKLSEHRLVKTLFDCKSGSKPSEEVTIGALKTGII